MAKRPAVRSQKLKTYRNTLASSPRTATSPPRRPAAGGSRRRPASANSVMGVPIPSSFRARGSGATRAAAPTARKKDWGKALNFAKTKSGAATTARKPASAATKAKWGRLSTAAKALGSTNPARAKAETAARKKGFTARDRAAAKRMMDRGTVPRRGTAPRRRGR